MERGAPMGFFGGAADAFRGRKTKSNDQCTIFIQRRLALASALFRGTPRSGGKKGRVKRATRPEQLFRKMQELRERGVEGKKTVTEWPLFRRSCAGEASCKKSENRIRISLLGFLHVVGEKC